MADIIVVGGFGSGREQMDFLADTIGSDRGAHAEGISYGDACDDIESFAERIDKCFVVGHSGAMEVTDTAIQLGARPIEYVGIAPPVRERKRRLLVKGALIGFGMRQDAWDELEQKFDNRHELMHHPIKNFAKRLPQLSRYDSLESAEKFVEQEIPTTLAYMERDGLFDLANRHIETKVAAARRLGVNVVSIEGTHCAFTHRPLQTLSQIALAQEFNIPERIRHPLIQQLLTAPLAA